MPANMGHMAFTMHIVTIKLGKGLKQHGSSTLTIEITAFKNNQFCDKVLIQSHKIQSIVHQ